MPAVIFIRWGDDVSPASRSSPFEADDPLALAMQLQETPQPLDRASRRELLMVNPTFRSGSLPWT